jgi:hypothetical protein
MPYGYPLTAVGFSMQALGVGTQYGEPFETPSETYRTTITAHGA